MPEDSDIKNFSLLYSENAKVAAAFWEWRYKVMTRFFTAIAALVAMASWFYQRSDLKPWVFVPFALAAIFSVLSDIMDRVNTKILRLCYYLGSEMEQKLSADAGVFKAIWDLHSTTVSYHWVLRVMYIGSAVVFAIIAVLAAILVR